MVAHDNASTPWLYVDSEGHESAIELGSWGDVLVSEGKPGSLRYAGQRADALTGLHYNRNRYYAPDLHLFTTPDPCGVFVSPHDVGFVPNANYWLDPLGLLTIIRGMDDPVVRASADRLAKANPGARVVDSSSIGDLSDETDVMVVSHGSPGSVGWNGGRANGEQLAQALNGAGFNGKQSGASVAVVACNSATPPAGSSSVAQGVADGTGASTSGAMANDVGASQRNERLPLSNGQTARPGSMIVGSDGRTAVVVDGQWVSTSPGGSPTPTSTGTTQLGGQTWGTGTIR
jgi:RHS repeat-associated protein